MGEVFRAHDTRLNRDVALKVLPQAFSNDSERVARFQQEAQAVAALNHPSIIAVFDIGESLIIPGLKTGAGHQGT